MGNTRGISLILVIVAGFLLRIYDLNYSFNVDEIFCVRAASRSFSYMIQAVISDRAHPPLYYMFLYPWMRVAGSSEVAVRLLSVLASVLLLAVVSKLAFKLTEGFPAWFLVAFCAVNGYLVYYGQEARPFAMAALFCTLSVWCVLKIQEDPGRKKYKLWYALSCAGVLYTHYVGLLFLLAQFAAVFMARFREKRGILFYGLLGSSSMIPWVLVMGRELMPNSLRPHLTWIARPDWGDLLNLYIEVMGWSPVRGTTKILLLVTLLTVASLLFRPKHVDWGKVILIGSSALFPLVVAFVVSRHAPVSIWAVRHLIGPVIMISCLLALGVAAHRRALALGLGSFLLLWCVLTLPGWLRENVTPDWRLAASSAREMCADCEINVRDIPTQIALSYYSSQPVYAIETRLKGGYFRSLPYWLPNPPERQHEADRILFVCQSGNCAALGSLLSRYQIAARHRVTWGHWENYRTNAFDVFLLSKTKDNTH